MDLLGSLPNKPSAPASKEIGEMELDDCIVLLITLGHANCLDYGFSFFQTCLRALPRIQQMAAETVAAGVAMLFQSPTKKKKT